MNVKKVSNILLALIPSVFLACSASSSQQTAVLTNNIQNANSQPALNPDIHPDPIAAGWMDGKVAIAWQTFIEGGKYRWARPSDFRFPDWAMQRYGHDLERAGKSPLQAGHIKGDYESDEIALLVVDTTGRDWNRYGVVIFSVQREKPENCEVKWVFQNQDLSRAQLGWSSGDTLNIARYDDDGSYSNCFVKWDKKQKRYFCNLKRIM